MKKQPLITIILCTLNESGHICELIDELAESLKNFNIEILLIDDNSSDRTFQLALEHAKENIFLRPYQRIGQRGLTTAIQTGINMAKGEIVCWLDADFSHPVEYIPTMIHKILSNDAQVVVASRFLPGSKDYTAIHSPLIKLQKILGVFLSELGQFFLNPNFTDWSSGFVAIKKECLNNLNLNGDYGEYFMELIFQCYQKKFKIIEIPFTSPPRRSGQSKTATNFLKLFWRGHKYLIRLARLSLRRWRERINVYMYFKFKEN